MFSFYYFLGKGKTTCKHNFTGWFFGKNLISIYECIIVEYNIHNRGKFSQMIVCYPPWDDRDFRGGDRIEIRREHDFRGLY